MEPFIHVIEDLFGVHAEPRDLSAVQMTARALLVFLSALVMLRVAHKRFFARRNAVDVLLTLVLASTLARAINGSAALLPTIAVGFVLVLVHRAIARAAANSERIGRLLKGTPVVLVEDGQIKRGTLKEHALTEHDLEEDLRLNGVDSAAAAQSATLERNGEVSVVKK